MEHFDQTEFRQALSSFATGVTIVTAANKNGEVAGMTASSFNSVSLSPPLVLWSVDTSNATALTFIEAEYFSINVLSSKQANLSDRFADPHIDKFSGVEYSNGIGGSRLITGAICQFECKTWAVYDGGDHKIIVGEVKKFSRSAGDGLIFRAGQYATSKQLSASSDA